MTDNARTGGPDAFIGDVTAGADQPQLLRIHVVDEDDACVIYVAGEIDASTYEELAAAIELAVRSERVRLVLDMAGVEFIDSSGLRALMLGHKSVAGADGSLRVRAASDPVVRLLTVTGQLTRFVD